MSGMVIGSELLGQIGDLAFGMSTRQGGVSAPPYGMNVSFRVGDREEDVRRNREKFFQSLGIAAETVATTKQVHSGTVLIVDSPGTYDDCDGLVTSRPGLFIGVTVADCVPVILVDPAERIVAALHAGWRGSVARIAEKGVETMVRCGARVERINAFLGPAAGACCYEVGEDVAAQFPAGVTDRRDGRIFLDVRKANRLQLTGAGIRPHLIDESPLCTISEKELLHSFRRDGDRSGRMMALVGFRR